MNSGTQAPEQLFGSEVTDTAGNNIGKVDSVWVDDATGELEFIAVKTGWLMGKNHVIPASDVQIDGQTIRVPYAQEQIKDAPSFSGDSELSPDNENQIYSHYGIDRSTAPSPTGLPAGDSSGGYQTDAAAYGGTGTSGGHGEGTSEENIRLSEEQLQVGKRQVEAGNVRLRKVVRTERVEQPVDLRREEVQIERVDASGADVPGDAFQERQVEVPVSREEPVVGKEAYVTGQVNVRKDVSTETQTVGGEVRKEDVEYDESGTNTGFNRNQGETDTSRERR